MTDAMIDAAIASSVVGLTRHVMATESLPDYEAYRRVTSSKTFALLSDSRTRYFLKTNAELVTEYDREKVAVDAAVGAGVSRGEEGAGWRAGGNGRNRR